MAKDANNKHWVGFDLGGTKMLAAIYNQQFEIVATQRKRSKGFEGKSSGVQRIQETIEQAIKEADIPRKSLQGIGIGCPGPVDWARGVLMEAVNLGWKNVPLRDELQQAFDCPVAVINDVDAGVYAEACFGAAQGAHCVLGVFPGTGIGGGCVYEGQILRGKRYSCMEIGHVPLSPLGPISGYGHEGTLEAMASRLAISAAAARAAYQGKAPFILQAAGTDIANIKSGVLSDAIRSGDQMVEQILRNAARDIGTVVSGAINLLAPDVVVLGGGLVEAMPELMVGGVRDAALRFVLPSFQEELLFTAAKLGDDACILGAAAWSAKSSGYDVESARKGNGS